MGFWSLWAIEGFEGFGLASRVRVRVWGYSGVEFVGLGFVVQGSFLLLSPKH